LKQTLSSPNGLLLCTWNGPKKGADLGLVVIATSADKIEENSVSTGSTHTQKRIISFWQLLAGCCWEFGEAIWCRG